MQDPTTTELTQQEWDWIANQISNALTFIATFSPGDTDSAITLPALDRAYTAWVATANLDNGAVNTVINCVGVALGQALVDGAGFAWVIATDDFGTDLAVIALPGTGNVLVFPTNFVAKRWERGESDFLEVSYRTILSQLVSIKQ